MKKNFTFTLPDEPYKVTTAKNQTVNCTYIGPRYLCLCIEEGTHMVRNVETMADNLADIQLETHVEEGHYFVIMDAVENPLEASYLNHYYTHEPVENYSETLTDADGVEFTFEFDYADTGVIGQVTYFGTLKYLGPNKYEGPHYRQHANTREETLKNWEQFATTIDQSLANPANDYTDEERTKLQGHADWLKSIRTRYANIDHWKVPFKTNIPIVL